MLGATPRKQQMGELLGVITSAGAVCMTLILLHNTLTLGSAEIPAPQATLMKLVIDGVLDQHLPWNLVFIGVGITLVVFLLRLPSLPFAVGVYLPLATMAAVFLGGLVRHLTTRKCEPEKAEARRERGVLFGSGMVGGEGLTGVFFALWVVIKGGEPITGLGLDMPYWLEQSMGVIAVACLVGLIVRLVNKPAT